MEREDEKFYPQHGRKYNQRLKTYLVMQYLLKNTDENNFVTAFDICAYLEELGIAAERRSIYSDIEEINKIMWMQLNDSSIEEAEEAIKDKEERMIAYRGGRTPGFYVRRRPHEMLDIRLLAECVYAAKFIPQKQADQLADIVFENASKQQAETIKHDALVVDRVKTLNKSVLNNISTLRDAMAKTLDCEPHTPEKVSFKYLSHKISNLEKPVESRRKYVVSPYHLIINDGNYYLLAFDDEKQDMRTYRVDRMKDIRFAGQPRDGEDAFRQLDMKNYTQRVFSMFSGEKKLVHIRFINPLLDTVIDRFGTSGSVVYTKADDKHFTVTAEVEISDQFFGWLCGFGSRAVLLSPTPIVEQYKSYLQKILSKY